MTGPADDSAASGQGDANGKAAMKLRLALVLLLSLLALLLFTGFTRRMSTEVDLQQASRMNGFTLDEALIPVEHIRSGGVGRDGIPAISMPELIDAEELAEVNFELDRRGAGAFLTPGQRVVGITVNGEARAYGINLLTWHEVVNDVVGGVPLAVIYCPLCDSVTVFERTVNGNELEFAVSGLLYNSNVLLYNREDERGEESLWSQLQMRAVTGPHAAAGVELEVLPAQLVDWASWLEMHPDTKLAYRSSDSRRDYSVNPYETYFEEGKLMFPAWPILPQSSPLHAMDRVIAVDNGSGWTVFPVRQLQRELSEESWLEVAGVRFALTVTEVDAGHVLVEPAEGAEPRIAYSFWFSWYAMHPDSEIFPVLD